VNQPPDSALPVSNAPAGGARIGWSFIPSLTLIGFFSGIFAFIFIWLLPYSGTQTGSSEYVLQFLASLSFGLSLAAVLWYYRHIQSWIVLAALLATTVAVHLLELFADRFIPSRYRDSVDVPLLGSITPEVVLRCFLVCFVLFAAFLLLTSPKRKDLRLLLIALTCAISAAITVGFLDGLESGGMIKILTGRSLELLWQTALAFFLGIALWVKHISFPAPSTTIRPPEPTSSPRNRGAVFALLLAYLVAVGIWSHHLSELEARRTRDLQFRIQAEIAQSIREAPSSQDLPPVEQKPLDEILLMHDVAGWSPYISGSQAMPPSARGMTEWMPPPNRIVYDVFYSHVKVEPNNNWAVHVVITDFPTSAWATYQVRNTPMPNELIEHPDTAKKLTKFSNTYYQEGAYVFWSSGNKLIFLECQGILPAVIDQFVQAYLAKYPSSL
jgi:hypothetical protein